MWRWTREGYLREILTARVYDVAVSSRHAGLQQTGRPAAAGSAASAGSATAVGSAAAAGSAAAIASMPA